MISATLQNARVTLLPTGQCFDDALERALADLKEARNTIIVCHGLCRLKGTEDNFSHAWTEDLRERNATGYARTMRGDACEFDASVREYYAEFGVSRVIKYTLAEAVALSALSDYGGPWDLELAKQCNDFHTSKLAEITDHQWKVFALFGKRRDFGTRYRSHRP